MPMGITNWLVVFCFALQQNGNVFYGIWALIGFMFAHLGTNVFDDAVDHLLKVPKQSYKTTHLDNGQTDMKMLWLLVFIYFSIALIVGIFFVIKCGYPVAIIAAIGGGLALLYPKLNNYALGEVAVGATFGVLLFAGIYFVMTGTISMDILLVSLPVSIFTVVVLMVHSLMDFDFDIKSNKRTLVILTGSKKNGLNLIFAFLIFAYLFTIGLVIAKILPLLALFTLITAKGLVPLYQKLNIYISNTVHENNEFIRNFSYARNIGTLYCFILTFSLLCFLIKT